MPDLELLFNTHTHTIPVTGSGIFQVIGNSLPVNSNFSLGIHPENALNFEVELVKIEQNQKHNFFKAIGETGLDTRYEIPLEIQEKCFVHQLQLASLWKKPIILHCVNQWDRCRFLYEKHAPNVPLIYHGFNKASILENVLKTENVYISIGASVLSNHSLQKKLELIPRNRLLVETDTADVQILEIYTCVAKNLSLSLQTLIEQVYSNAKTVFKL